MPKFKRRRPKFQAYFLYDFLFSYITPLWIHGLTPVYFEGHSRVPMEKTVIIVLMANDRERIRQGGATSSCLIPLHAVHSDGSGSPESVLEYVVVR